MRTNLGINYTNRYCVESVWFRLGLSWYGPGVGTYRSWTGRPKDASSKGRIVQERGVQERGVQESVVQGKVRIVQGTHCPRDALFNGRNVWDFSFGDTSVRDTLSCHPSNDRKESLCQELQHSLFTKRILQKSLFIKMLFSCKNVYVPVYHCRFSYVC